MAARRSCVASLSVAVDRDGSLTGPRRYAVDIYRWGAQVHDPADFKIILVDVLEDARAFTDGRAVILNRRGTWHLDNSLPT